MYHFYQGENEGKELCFNIETSEALTAEELSTLNQLLAEGFLSVKVKKNSNLDDMAGKVELGPRLNFATPFSTNAVAICHSCGLTKVKRIEQSRIFILPETDDRQKFVEKNHDKMTEYEYVKPLESFSTGIKPAPVFMVPLIEEGIEALKKINKDMGLGMDEWDENFYYNLFVNDLKRNPTNVECFQLGQANSEHSRHWFFKGKMEIDGETKPESLLEIVISTWKANKNNSLIAFKDNSSAIKGYKITTIIPREPGEPSAFEKSESTYHIIFTAETHNFPSGVAPFPGAETGAGGRIRDVQATGRGALVLAGTAGYCVGNLNIPGYDLPWEDKTFAYPDNLARPLKIEIEASNGASDYGNKFGEPLIQGFTRSFGLTLPTGERQEWLKPIMFSGGIGQIDDRHVEKEKAQIGMLIIQIGGPAYRIGMGGGAASSMIQGENKAELDFNAVQRGDAEMEQKMNRVVRASVELGDDNPVISIHDQGAGGPCNVLTELVDPVGGKILIRNIRIGDETMSVLEIWGAEFQERNALLINSDRVKEFEQICQRERCSLEILGEITGDGRITLFDSQNKTLPVNLELAKILGKMPQKVFKDSHIKTELKPLELPRDLTLKEALTNVLCLLAVGSKRFLTTKVDRSVTGLIARQQCIGPLQLTVSDVSAIAQSHFNLTGAAIAIGEQPNKMIINPAAGARMSVGEALTNMAGAKISALEDIKCSGNWMWAAKLPGEAARIYDAAVAARDLMVKLGIAVDGGKDSLSMATKVEGKIIKSPGELVVSVYATMPNILKIITPDIKRAGQSTLWLLDLGKGKDRLGGSALAQVNNQVGDNSPDVDDAELLKNVFLAVQEMVDKNTVSAVHDRSDGGLITTILEMAFSGNCGLEINYDKVNPLSFYFNEELGIVLEVEDRNLENFKKELEKLGLKSLALNLGRTTEEQKIKIMTDGEMLLDEDMKDLRQIWEQTSFQLEKIQIGEKYATEESQNIYNRPGPKYQLSFTPALTDDELLGKKSKPKVAIIREEGSNGDREMTSAFFQAGFEPWDITMTDLLTEKINLDIFRGVVFVGGFAYADVLGSAKGWAGTIRFNQKLKQMFDKFYNRPDTFSLGVCNGCQLMGLLGWVPWKGLADEKQPHFVKNASGRFESRWVTVKVLPSQAMMFKGMENSILGIWVAHGEGYLNFPDKELFNNLKKEKLASLAFVDDNNLETENYPFNPNGSPEGITGICSPDGRHLAVMPHPERAFLLWQWPWLPENFKNLAASPWLKMFQNAREWCERN
jgi:phosphoribosylformylglycinamidine synthase